MKICSTSVISFTDSSPEDELEEYDRPNIGIPLKRNEMILNNVDDDCAETSEESPVSRTPAKR